MLVTAGGMHAIGLVLRELAALGHRRALHATPVFVGVHDLMLRRRDAPRAPSPSPSTPGDLPLLLAHVDGPTVVYLNLPHNPTGAVLSPDYLPVLGELAAHPDVFVLYDAVYDSFDFRPAPCPAPVDLAVSGRAHGGGELRVQEPGASRRAGGLGGGRRARDRRRWCPGWSGRSSR